MEREVRECKTSDKDGGYFNMKGDGAMLAYARIWMKGVENVYVRSYPTNDRFCDFCNCTLNFSYCYRYFYDEKITIFKLWTVKMVII